MDSKCVSKRVCIHLGRSVCMNEPVEVLDVSTYQNFFIVVLMCADVSWVVAGPTNIYIS